MIGLNDKLLYNYVEWIANRRMKAYWFRNLSMNIPAKNNPLPWTEHWISSKGLQVCYHKRRKSSPMWLVVLSKMLRRTPLQIFHYENPTTMDVKSVA